MSRIDGQRRVFVSYTWDSDGHKTWVRALAERLESRGLQVRLDQWNFGAGDQLPHLMESEIRAADKVLLICTPSYKKKADEREGGGGYEANLMSAEVAARGARQFIPVLRSGSFSPGPDCAVPDFLAGVKGIDFTGSSSLEDAFESLLHAILDIPQFGPPVRGEIPALETKVHTPHPDFAAIDSAPQRRGDYAPDRSPTPTTARLARLHEWDYVREAARDIHEQSVAQHFYPTLVVGVGRSGAILAALISGHFGSIHVWVNDVVWIWLSDNERHVRMLAADAAPPEAFLKRVLVVDGELHSSRTIEYFRSFYEKRGAEVRTAVAYIERRTQLPCGRLVPDMFAAEVALPRDHAFWRGLPWKGPAYRSPAYSRNEWESWSHDSGPSAAIQRDVFLVRHGESVANVGSESYSGITDHELSERGRRQADQVGAMLRIVGLRRVYSSPLKRALGTANAICERTGAELVIVPELVEMDYGEWEDKEKPFVDATWPVEHAAWKDNPVTHTPPKGEPALRVLERVRTWWAREIAGDRLQPGDRVAVVSHKTVLRLLVCDLTGRDPSEYRRVSMRNATVSRVEVSRGGMSRLADTNISAG